MDRVTLLPDGTTLVETGQYVYPLPGGSVVEALEPFKINSSTGAIAVNDPDVLAVGDTWEVVVRVTDALSATDDGTFTVELVEGAVTPSPRTHFYGPLAGCLGGPI